MSDPGAGTTLVVYNPAAGGANPGGADRDDIEAALRRRGLTAEIFVSDTENDARRRVQAALAAGVTTIVAAGGDGTVRSVAFELLGKDAALGILPFGTAMNVARSLDIPTDLDGATRILAEGTPREIDVGELRGRPFLEVAWVGAGAAVLWGAEEARQGRFGRALGIARWAIRHPRTRMRLQLDGREVRGRAPSVAIANGRFTGRAIEVAPEARIDDGRFDVLLFDGYAPLGLALHLGRVLLGRRTRDPRIRRYRASVVRVSTHRPLPVRADSEEAGHTPIEVSIRPRGLRVIAPTPPGS